MKLDINIKDGKRNEIMTSVAISPSNSDVIVACDDKTFMHYNSEGVIQSNPIDVGAHVTALSWFPSERLNYDLIAVVCSDGTLGFMKKNGTLEKKVAAHEGAAICVEWNSDGSSLATSGEDGEVKIWSRTGNLRTKLAAYSQPVYSLSWGPDNNSLLVTNKNKLVILRTQARGDTIQWENHPKEKGVIMAVDWNNVNDLIISGGEDCCFRIFDSYGLPLFVSSPHEHIITSVAWRPNGTSFAVGSFNMIHLRDRRGWGYSRERIEVGSIMNMEWSSDGTQLTAACGNGKVFFSHLIERTIEWGGLTAKLVETKKIVVIDSTDSCNEETIEFSRDPVVDFSLAFNNLVVCTQTQCHIFSLPNLHAPHILDLKSPVTLIIMSATNFALVNNVSGVLIYSYEGRYLSSPRFQGLRPEVLSEDSISVSQDTVAIIDSTDQKIIRLFDIISGKPLGDSMAELKHEMEISKIALSQCGSTQQERRLVFVDRKNELFISPVTPLQGIQKQFLIQKLGTQVDSVSWNDSCDILTAMMDSRLVTWFYPNAPYVDKDLLDLSKETKDGMQFGKSPQIKSFHETNITVRRYDGALVTESIHPYPPMIHEYATTGKWEEAVRLCRFVENDFSLWATLSGFAIQFQELGTAEIALSAIKEVDKMQHIKFINSIKCHERKSAEMLLYRRCPEEAVSVLLQGRPPLVYRAIKVYIRLFKWEKALDIAVKRKTYIDVVLWYRKRYLKDFDKSEDSAIFEKYFSEYGELDGDRILDQKAKAKAKEEKSEIS